MIDERIPYEVTATLTIPQTTVMNVVEAASEKEAKTSAFDIWQNIFLIKGPAAGANALAEKFQAEGLSATVPLPADSEESERMNCWGTPGIVWINSETRRFNLEKLRQVFGGFTPLGAEEALLQIPFETTDWAPRSWISKTIERQDGSDLEVGLITICIRRGVAYVTFPNRNRQHKECFDLGRAFKDAPWVEYRLEVSEKDTVVPHPEEFSGVLTAERADHKTRQYDVTFGAWVWCTANGVIEATSSSEAGRIAEEKLHKGDTGFLQEYDDPFFAADEWSLEDVAIAS